MTDHTFGAQLAAYKKLIDDDIATYADYLHTSASKQFGPAVAQEVDTFLDVLSRGGKRLRGALVMVGYEMCGGTNKAMIIQAARAIEMLHAYMLIVDDIQDRSPLRRGKPSAHVMLAAWHRAQKLKGDPDHFGMSVALDAAYGGAHAAQAILANMDADPQLKLNVLSITNRTLSITAHGQTQDMVNAASAHPTSQDIEHVLEWKSALYSFINPLHVGMVLAGAGCEATDAITPYATHLGKAFQIIDDIEGIFGSAKEQGTSPLDDILEGKMTILTHYALAHASATDAAFLRSCLGNQQLTAKDFAHCKQVLESSGARAFAAKIAATQSAQALEALDVAKGLWDEQGSAFLRALVGTFQDRAK
ncbi:MAG TPA: polyprenyl synthetase family protein [Patescibacteria group bacterium]|nr:polyprenyl synthetase family protein [Patescibacteria group bacterium]